MTVRTALIGYGLAGRVIHRPLLLAEPGLSVTHVVTADPERRAQAGSDLPGARLLSSAEELWSSAPEFDAVVVAAPNTVHVPLALRALDLRKATVVDKPVALTVDDAQRLVGRAHDRGVPLSAFHNRRWDSDTLTARRLLEEGRLGEVIRLESRFARFRPEVARRWREDAAAGGGVLLDLGTHVVDQALLLLGPAVEVYAEVDVRRAGGSAEDDVFLALTHASGARSHLWCSMAAPAALPRLVLQGSLAGWAKDGLDGQEDAQRHDRALPPEPDGRLWDTGGEHAHPSEQGDWGAYYRGFVAAVTTGAPVPVDPADAERVLQVLGAARVSARERAVVPVDA